MTLIPIGQPHAETLAALHHISFAAPWSAKAMAELMALPGSFGFLAQDETGSPQGFILCRVAADEAEILTFMVLPPWRRKGIASLLLAQAIQEARDKGAASLFLETAVTNQAAIALYEKDGFVIVGKRPRYYEDGGDALLLRRDIDKPRI